MEYRVNKIDPDLRKKIGDARGEGKIHTKKGITINKDKENAKENMKSKHESFNEILKNKVITKDVPREEEPYKGHNIDIRR